METFSALRWPVNSPNKGQWRGGLMFSFYAWINGWVNNRDAGGCTGAYLAHGFTYSSQNIFNANNFNPHKNLILLLNIWPSTPRICSKSGDHWRVLPLSLDPIEVLLNWCWYMYSSLEQPNGPLTRYVKLWVAHAPGMPGTFFPPSASTELVR